jgi:hypothetical protein
MLYFTISDGYPAIIGSVICKGFELENGRKNLVSGVNVTLIEATSQQKNYTICCGKVQPSCNI